MSAHQYDEGHTVAGWTGFGIATVGATVLGLGVCLVSVPAIAGGLAICAVALLTTWALHLQGWGKPPGRRPREEWPMRARDPQARAGHLDCLGCRLAGRGRRAVILEVPVEVEAEVEAVSGGDSVRLSPVE
ncbi:putative membrane protein [Streptomyces davaonensis JCM 4913]|uniref:Putative membrane protein n=1 Tax=Streptomyces davaonensis (strain DSM 101723 / JCM 4913 / KCC S-0913 / 768) TaxID=1214101 RepID=K4R6P2_STRDJ|nr:HGxxPAAW family protein [Streptomyces davaonensis]CCK29028.1 putative membrane protein [Streptomyces davaonensis JCM 4913]